VIAAAAFVVLVAMLAIPLLKLGRALDEATLAIRKTHEGVTPLLTAVQGTLDGANAELEQVEQITRSVNTVTTNVATLASIVSSTLTGSVIKVAAFGYGVRRALQSRRDADAVREARRQRGRGSRGGSGGRGGWARRGIIRRGGAK